MKRLIGMFAMLAVVVGCGGPAEQAAPPPEEPTFEEEATDDIATAAPESVSVLLDNDWVRVLRIEVAAGSELPRHDAGDRVVYSLSDYTIEWAEGDEPAEDKSWAAGEAHWHAGGPHALRNVGPDAAEFLVVERKQAALPDVEIDPEAVPSSPENSSTLLENESVTVAEVELEPGETTGRHTGGHRVVYSLSDYTIQWTEGDAAPTEVSWSEGDAHWHVPAAHEVENVGDGPARYLVVTLSN
jgi:quercetin dioxygenase-like cupin family protein